MDWASQPSPFRSFAGAREIALPPRPDGIAAAARVGDILRHALGLSAWKEHGPSRWSLRVNPSSGNLHPTEAYIVAGPASGLDDRAGVYHYAPDRHALEQRCAFDGGAWPHVEVAGQPSPFLVALTSIHWRESWKYGERAFRYCQHDLGHAIAALAYAAALTGWLARMLPEWSHRDIAALTGIDRDEDYVEAEREEPQCLLWLEPVLEGEGHLEPVGHRFSAAQLLDAVRNGVWTGRASQLSEDHVAWTFIDDIAEATVDPGRGVLGASAFESLRDKRFSLPAPPAPPAPPAQAGARALPSRALILQRRSALAFDGMSSIDADRFFAMLSAAMPSDAPPWDAMWWDPRIHLALFVHRVTGLAPGLYLLPRDPRAVDRLKSAFGREFSWESASDAVPLVRLAEGGCRALAQRVCCDQEIAADGFFSLGMIADFSRSLEEFGPSFYRHLFWESGIVGQALYLAAEQAGARATGIGCFYDDPMHEVLGIDGHAFQSLYHFTVGMPVEDRRLTTEPGYKWETPA